MSKSYRVLDQDDLFRSFKVYEAHVENEVKMGLLNNQQARALIESAKNNYRKQNYNREIEKVNAS